MSGEQRPPFGDLLRRHRQAAGLTQEELAERAGLSVDAISTLERGARLTPRKDTVALLADALTLAGDDRAAFLAAARHLASPTTADAGTLSGRHAHNLPAQLTPLLGREREVATLSTVLRQDQVRLLTLTGPGGVGKTRLGLQVATELVDAFPDGVWFARLARLTDPALVVPTIAQTLGLREAGRQPIAAVLLQYLRPRALLLLLDNFEHVLAAAPQVADLLATSPGLRVLVTSRVGLHLQGEHEVPVAPLAVTAERGADAPAVLLFVQRAQAGRPDFQVTDATAPPVAAICARLEGLPLAIELAAPWVKLLPPAHLLDRLDRQLPLLTGGVQDLEEHQQTMRSTLAWSYDLLAPAAQRLFRRLAVFVGGCTLEAAEMVCLAPEGAEPLGLNLLDGLAVLIDHSLVQQRVEGGEPRFGMLHIIREYALERLEANEAGNEAAALWQAHAAYYVALAEREWAAVYTGTAEDRFATNLRRLGPEQDNLRAVLAWLLAQAEAGSRAGRTERVVTRRTAMRRSGEAPVVQGLRLAGALHNFWALRGQLREGRAWLEAFLALDTTAQGAAGDQSEPGAGASSTACHSGKTGAARSASEAFARGLALFAAGLLAYWQGESAQAVPLLERSLTLAREQGDGRAASAVLNNLGMAFQDQGDLARARACYEEALALSRARNDLNMMANPLVNLSRLTLAVGDLEQAALYSEEALAVSHQSHYHIGAADTLSVQALIAWRRGQLSQAAALAEEALELDHAARDERHYGDGLELCAIICATQGRIEQAARLLGAAAASRARIGMRRRMNLPTVDDIDVAVAPARAALGEEAWAAAFAAGQALSLEEAIAEALEEPG
jgi:predicted ATPase/DNA-binding XRE family transcriptional regulator